MNVVFQIGSRNILDRDLFTPPIDPILAIVLVGQRADHRQSQLHH